MSTKDTPSKVNFSDPGISLLLHYRRIDKDGNDITGVPGLYSPDDMVPVEDVARIAEVAESAILNMRYSE